MARQGKIARLPLKIREELNRRILNGELGPKILPWLNSLPETKEILGEDFEGLAVNDQNLSDWRAGGYRDWELRHARLAHTRELAQVAVELAQASGGSLTEGSAAIAAGKILEVLEACDGNMSPEALKELITPLVNLRSGDIEREKMERKSNELKEKFKRKDEELKLARERFDLTLREYQDKQAEAKRKLEQELSVVKSTGGITPETLERIEQAVKIL